MPESPIETQTPTRTRSLRLRVMLRARPDAVSRVRMPADHKQRAPFYLWPATTATNTSVYSGSAVVHSVAGIVNATAAEQREERTRERGREREKKTLKICLLLMSKFSDLALKVFLAMFCNHKLTKCINCFVCFYCATELDVQCRRAGGGLPGEQHPLGFYDANFR